MNHGRVGVVVFFWGGNPNDLNISSERFLIQASLGPEPRLVGGLNPLA